MFIVLYSLYFDLPLVTYCIISIKITVILHKGLRLKDEYCYVPKALFTCDIKLCVAFYCVGVLMQWVHFCLSYCVCKYGLNPKV